MNSRTQVGDRSADAARDAYANRRWAEAVERYAAAEGASESLTGEDHLHWGMATYWLRDLDGAIGRLETAAQRCREEGATELEARALQATIQIASWGRRNAVVATCSARLLQLLESTPEAEAHAIWQWAVARIVIESDFDEGARQLEEALATALRVESANAEALSLTSLSQVDTVACRVEEAVRKVDAAAALALSGDVEDLVAGGVLCGIIWSCRNVADWDRASEWTEVATRWADRAGVSVYPGQCHFHRCEILRVRGDLADAESHAMRACEELVEIAPENGLGYGYRELGRIRLLRGDHDGARAAFRLAVEHGTDPNPGLALLRLREGNAAGARRGLEEAFDAPLAGFEVPFLLPVLVTVCLAEGDVAGAQRAVDRLAALADQLPSDSHRAATAQARAEIARELGDLAEAHRQATSAARLWKAVGAPHEAARARETLGEIGVLEGSLSDATFDLETAMSSYDRIGAAPDVERLQQRLTLLGSDDRPDAPQAVRAFMFTDIIDSTRLQSALGDDNWLTLLDWHDRTLRQVIADHHGTVIKHEGDGLFAEFPRADAALASACQIQTRLREHRAETGFAPEVRIGVHEGLAHPRSDGDWIGLAVTVAARVAASGGSGDVVCTDAALAAAPAADVLETRSIEAKGVDHPLQVHLVRACPSA